jgi:hypothetical protein
MRINKSGLAIAAALLLPCNGCITQAMLSNQHDSSVWFEDAFADDHDPQAPAMTVEYRGASPNEHFAVDIPIPHNDSGTTTASVREMLNALEHDPVEETVVRSGILTDADTGRLGGLARLANVQGGDLTAVICRRLPNGKIGFVTPEEVSGEKPLPVDSRVVFVRTVLPAPQYAVDRNQKRKAGLVPFTLLLDAVVDVPMIVIVGPIYLIAFVVTGESAAGNRPPTQKIHPTPPPTTASIPAK